MTGTSQWTSPAASQLPQGWRQLTDPGSGRIYYANTQTGQTQWSAPANERLVQTPTRAPTLLLAPKFDAVADSVPNSPTSSPAKGSLTKIEEADEDESQTWKTSQGEHQHITASVVEQSVTKAAAAVGAASPAPTSSTPAPAYGSGIPLVQSPAASASSSSKTPLSPVAAAAAVQSVAAAGTTPAQALTTDDLPVGWKALNDPTTGKTYYYSIFTGKTQWARPTIPPPPPVQTPVATGPSLPAGWKAISDPRSGRTYYWNQSTGTSQVRPA
jgi:hypothetical protein